MGLREYKRKRDFKRTPEPEGTAQGKPGRSFCVQKHDASHLHYDFRLELDGVLKSWAVPKGPSLDPSVKRLAVHVEDHPVEYGGFEGTIPEGEYGGGTVLLWDRGHWEPVGDPQAAYASGRLKFTLHGEKLRGGWMLLRTGKSSQYVQQKSWLLFKEKDGEARPSDRGDILEQQPLSVASGRSLKEIAAGKSGGAHQRNGKASKPARSRRGQTKKGANQAPFNSNKLQSVRLTSPDKVLYPEQGITKRELARYLEAVGDWMLPQIAGRPLVLVRCPEGRHKDCFYQKHPGPGTPAALKQVTIRESQKTVQYSMVEDLVGLVSLAQIGALEIHTWGSRADRLERPDRLIFDLDPGPQVPWQRMIQAARQVRQFLQELGLESFVKTTGGKGLHIVVPIDRRHDWDEAKTFCKHVAELIVAADPKHYTAKMSKAVRTGKIFVDYLRNGRGATAVAPYSMRARPDAPVSTPLAWEELSPRIESGHYTIRNLPRRLASLQRDPWQGIDSLRQGLKGPTQTLQSLHARSLSS